jgi:hypothetical protein
MRLFAGIMVFAGIGKKPQSTTNMRALRTAREAGQQFSQGAPVGPRRASALAVFPRAHARERSDV